MAVLHAASTHLNSQVLLDGSLLEHPLVCVPETPEAGIRLLRLRLRLGLRLRTSHDFVGVEPPVSTAPFTTAPGTACVALFVVDLAVLFHIRAGLAAPAPI